MDFIRKVENEDELISFESVTENVEPFTIEQIDNEIAMFQMEVTQLQTRIDELTVKKTEALELI